MMYYDVLEYTCVCVYVFAVKKFSQEQQNAKKCAALESNSRHLSSTSTQVNAAQKKGVGGAVHTKGKGE